MVDCSIWFCDKWGCKMKVKCDEKVKNENKKYCGILNITMCLRFWNEFL